MLKTYIDTLVLGCIMSPNNWSDHRITIKTMDSTNRPKVHENIVDQFHFMIRNGTLSHGQRLASERDLSNQYKVSRSSIREAIRSLELQGLVVRKRGSGTFVNTEGSESILSLMATKIGMGSEGLNDIFEMRRVLEPAVASLAAQRATPDDIARMREILEDQQLQINNGGTGSEADTAFHFAMAAATHNMALNNVFTAVEDIFHRSRDKSFQKLGRPERSLLSHRQILEMIIQRDSLKAQQAMDHHLEVVEPDIIPTWSERDSYLTTKLLNSETDSKVQ